MGLYEDGGGVMDETSIVVDCDSTHELQQVRLNNLTAEVVTLVRWPDRWLQNGRKAVVVNHEGQKFDGIEVGLMSIQALPDGEDWPE